MTDHTTETALSLLYRHGLPEDVIDGALALHAQELAAAQRAAHDERRPYFHMGLPCTPGFGCHVGEVIDLIDPTRTGNQAAVSAGQPATDRTALRDRIAHALEREDAINAGYDHGFASKYGVDSETDRFVDAVLAVLPTPAAPAVVPPTDRTERRKHWEARMRDIPGWSSGQVRIRDAAIVGMTVADAELASVRDLLRAENQRANSAIDRETTTEEAEEEQRLALSQALGLGTSAPWDAIRDRAEELRRLAGEAQQDPAQAERRCRLCDEPITGKGVTHFGAPDGPHYHVDRAACRFAGGLPAQPAAVSRPDAPAVGVQQPTETPS